jgi:hypothetical protein
LFTFFGLFLYLAQDLMADPLLGLSAGALRMDAAAAAAGAQGVLVKDILSAEEELRVSEGGMHSSDASLGGRLWTMPSVAKCCKLLHACSWMLCTQLHHCVNSSTHNWHPHMTAAGLGS